MFIQRELGAVAGAVTISLRALISLSHFFLYLTIDSQEKRYYMLNDLWLFNGEFGYGLECLKEYRVTVSMHFSYIQIDHP
jgi:hypothetical protein